LKAPFPSIKGATWGVKGEEKYRDKKRLCYSWDREKKNGKKTRKAQGRGLNDDTHANMYTAIAANSNRKG